MVIQQGDIYWINLGEPSGSEPGYSQIRTVIVCALTTNLRRAKAIGNILIEPEEANLSEPSVVNVSQIFTVAKGLLTDKVGTLSDARVRQIIAGLTMIIEPI